MMNSSTFFDLQQLRNSSIKEWRLLFGLKHLNWEKKVISSLQLVERIK